MKMTSPSNLTAIRCRFPVKSVISIHSRGIWGQPYIFASGLAKMKTNNLLAQCLFSNCWEAWSLVIQCCMCLTVSQLREMQSVPWPWAVEPQVQRSEPSLGSCLGSSPLPPNRNTRCIVQYAAETFLRPGLHWSRQLVFLQTSSC